MANRISSHSVSNMTFIYVGLPTRVPSVSNKFCPQGQQSAAGGRMFSDQFIASEEIYPNKGHEE
jgi:hypothetical protein